MATDLKSNQLFRFLLVGSFTFLIDFLLLLGLTDYLLIHYLVSASLAFFFASTINYFLSRRYVFHSKTNFSKKFEYFVFISFTFLGALINNIVIFIGENYTNSDLWLSKIISLIIVTVFNFITKKIIVFGEEIT